MFVAGAVELRLIGCIASIAFSGTPLQLHMLRNVAMRTVSVAVLIETSFLDAGFSPMVDVTGAVGEAVCLRLLVG